MCRSRFHLIITVKQGVLWMFHKCGCPLLATRKTPHFLSAVQGELRPVTFEPWLAHGDPDKTQIWKQSCELLQGWLIRLAETPIDFLSLEWCLNTLEASDSTNPLRVPVWHTRTKSRGHTDSRFKSRLYNHFKTGPILTRAENVPRRQTDRPEKDAFIWMCGSNFLCIKSYKRIKLVC